MTNYNQPPTPASLELETLIQKSLCIDPRKPLNKLSSHCFSTLNNDAMLFMTTGLTSLYQATECTINKLGLDDLKEFMEECRNG